MKKKLQNRAERRAAAFKQKEEPKVIKCPSCGRRIDLTVATLNGKPVMPLMPIPGKPMLCRHCQAVSIFGEDLQLRRLTTSEIETMDPELVAAIQTLTEGFAR